MLTTTQRRARLRDLLANAFGPKTGGELAAELGVTRQVIVQDIAVLRAAGEEIIATPRGYTINRHYPGQTGTIACQHGMARVQEELYTIVDLGGEVVDVIVEHPIYGQITGSLHLTCRRDVDAFLADLEKGDARLLSSLTDGVHLHTVAVRKSDDLDRIRQELADRGLLLGE
ncbi:MAG: transcription repressor NadR [Bacillota bacterium]|jgi:transcriptional regulator of NAD metabolism